MQKKILIIDDSIFFLHVLRDALAVDFFVKTAMSGEEAITLLKEADCDSSGYSESFDLIVTDIMMPGLSGYDVVKFVRGKDWKNKFTPIIMISGKVIPKEETKEYGCTTYIPTDNLRKIVSMARMLTM